VITIPATRSRYTADPIGSRKKRRVAAYARVSTDYEEQQSSYKAQVDYYTNYINGRDDWEFVSVYADEGVTGCNTKKRDNFNKMVEDALSGGIEMQTAYLIQRPSKFVSAVFDISGQLVGDAFKVFREVSQGNAH